MATVPRLKPATGLATDPVLLELNTRSNLDQRAERVALPVGIATALSQAAGASLLLVHRPDHR